MKVFVTESAEETRTLGRSFAGSLNPGDVVAMVGTLGSGKTQFVSGACEALGVTGHVSSPTFTLINEYAGGRLPVVHIDLYRIRSNRELFDLGIEEYYDGRHVCFIEWADQGVPILPPECYEVTMRHGMADSEREIVIDRRKETIQ